MKHLPHLATRIFDTPLLIAPQKFEVILAVLAPRLGLAAPETPVAARGSDRPASKPYEVTPDGIAVIPIEGTLVHKAYGLDALSGLRSYTDLEEEIEDAASDPAIKGIVLDVDSPGGEVAGVFDLADTIYAARQIKPIFAVANNDAFSAAYLLGSAAERMYVSRTSGIGSIGVIVSHLDVSRADEKVGFKYTLVHAGARKADFNPHTPLSEEARAVLEAEVERTYKLLVAAVARNRRVAEEKVRGTEAGLFFGEDAVQAGLADRMGTRQDVLNALRQRIASPETAYQLRGGAMESHEVRVEGVSTVQAIEPVPAEPATSIEKMATANSQSVEHLAGARKAGFDQAREIVEMCVLAGMPGEAASLLARYATPAEARQHLLERRAAVARPEIHSHVLPETGTSISQQASLDNNPVVKAAERLAAANRK